MSIFEMHRLIIDEYRKYVQSFLSVADERVRSFIETPVRGSPNCHQDYEKMKAGIPCGSGSPDRYFFHPENRQTATTGCWCSKSHPSNRQSLPKMR